jgi:cell division septation protein DedD
MTSDHEPRDEVKEFRLEGTTLVVAVALLLAVLAGIFYLGRRVERSGAPAPAGAAKAEDPLAESGSAPAPASQKPAAASDGPWFVQVWAGRDREAAELLVDKLQGQGYPVRLFTDRVEGDSLYKVRVGGYSGDAEARRVSGELEGKGYRGAWVTSVH